MFIYLSIQNLLNPQTDLNPPIIYLLNFFLVMYQIAAKKVIPTISADIQATAKLSLTSF